MLPPSEYWKALFGTGLGFVAGLLSEPIRLAITDRVKRRQMRKALYWDVFRCYWDLVQLVYKGKDAEESGKQVHRAMRRYIRDDLLEHYHKTEPGNLYRLMEFHELENFYSHLRSLRTQKFPTGRDYEMYMRDILNLCDYYVRSDRFNKRIMYRLVNKDQRKHWDDPNLVFSKDSFEELL